MSYIEREAYVKYLASREAKFIDDYGKGWSTGISAARKTAEKFPAADVAPVVHGRWEHDHYEDCTEQFEIVKCSNCGYSAYAMALFVKSGNYCPNCGARMDLEVNDG